MENIFAGMSIEGVMQSITGRRIKTNLDPVNPTFQWDECGFSVKLKDKEFDITALEMLQALALAGFYRREAIKIFIINEKTGKTISKNAMGGKIERHGIEFNTPPSGPQGGQKKRVRPTNAYAALNGKAQTANGSPPSVSKPPPPLPAPVIAPADAKLLSDVPENGCEMPVGENAQGKPMYCARPGRMRRLKGGVERTMCDEHRAKLG